MDTPLLSRVLQEIDAHPRRSISCADFMRLALYEPSGGYYADPKRVLGRRGDFYTSVSVGPVFGWILGYALEARWERHGRPFPWLLVEQGAHDGQLLSDVLDGLEARGSALLEGLELAVIEPLEARREILRDRLEARGVWVFPDEKAAAQAGLPRVGLYLSNELLDAFPVHRLVWEGDQWRECRVTRSEPDGEPVLKWEAQSLESEGRLKDELSQRLDGIDWQPEEGYHTEICLEVRPWMTRVAELFDRGWWWCIDYGFGGPDYFATERRGGGLRGYREHRALEPEALLEAPGEVDLTASVNFDQVAEEAQRCGLRVAALEDQHRFLTHAAMPWLREIESPDQAPGAEVAGWLRQFQTLTHPGLMGRSFKVLELERDRTRG